MDQRAISNYELPHISQSLDAERALVKEFGSDPVQAFPGHGQMKPEQQEIERLRREATS